MHHKILILIIYIILFSSGYINLTINILSYIDEEHLNIVKLTCELLGN